MNMNVTVNINPEQITKLRGLDEGGHAQKTLINEITRLSKPYIPMQSGALQNSAQPQQDKIVYPGPYAHYQHEGQAMVSSITGSAWAKTGVRKVYSGKGLTYHGGPMRGPDWTNRMWADRGDEIVDGVAVIVGGRRV